MSRWARTRDDGGVNFAVFSAHAEAIELCLFDADGGARRRAARCPGRTDGVFHGFLPGAGPGSSTACARTARAAPSAASASTRTSCCSTLRARDRRPLRLGRDQRLRARHAQGNRRDRTARQRRARAEGARRARRCDWDRDPAHRNRRAADTRALRAARQGLLDGCTRTCRRRCAAPTPALAHPACDRALQARSASHAVAAAGAVPRSTSGALASAACVNYWGYNTLGFFAPTRAYAAEPDDQPAARRIPRDGRGAARRRHRGGARRRLQPHARRQRARPDARACAASTTRSWYRLTRDDRSRCENLERLRQHAQRRASARAAARARLAALLGERDGRRRLPLRPRAGARPRRRTASIRTRRSSPRSPGSGAGARAS